MKNRYKTYINENTAKELFEYDYNKNANPFLVSALENIYNTTPSEVLKHFNSIGYDDKLTLWLEQRDMHTDSEPEKEQW